MQAVQGQHRPAARFDMLVIRPNSEALVRERAFMLVTGGPGLVTVDPRKRGAADPPREIWLGLPEGLGAAEALHLVHMAVEEGGPRPLSDLDSDPPRALA